MTPLITNAISISDWILQPSGIGTMIRVSRQIVGAEILSIEMLYTMSALQKRTTEHTEYTERVRFMNNKDHFWPLGAL